MCQEHCWSISFFIFWKYGLNYTRKSKFWPSYACCCLEIMARNHKNLNFYQTLRLHISHGHHLYILFSGFCESNLGVLILCGAEKSCASKGLGQSDHSKSIFIQKLLCNAAHNCGGLRSGILDGIPVQLISFLVSKNEGKNRIWWKWIYWNLVY